MALDVDVIADALFAGTTRLLERKLAPVLAANAALLEENERLSQRLALVEGREIPVFDPSEINDELGHVKRVLESLEVDKRIEERLTGVTKTLEDGLASIPRPEPLPDIDGMVAKATEGLQERLKGVEGTVLGLPTVEAIEAAVAPLREAVDAVKAVEVPDVTGLVEAEVAKQLAPQLCQQVGPEDIAAIVAAEVDKIPVPQDGKDAELPDIAAMIAAEVAKIPAPQDGKDAELPDIAAMVAAEVAKIPVPADGKDAELPDIAAMVAAEVAKIPAPADGKDAELPDIPALINEAVAPLVAEAVAQIQLPELPDVKSIVAEEVAKIPAPVDGKDAELPDIPALVAEAVAQIQLPELPDVKSLVMEEVAKIPAPADGKDAELPDIPALVAEAVAQVPLPELPDVKSLVAEEVAKIPPARDGKDYDPAVLDELKSGIEARFAELDADHKQIGGIVAGEIRSALDSLRKEVPQLAAPTFRLNEDGELIAKNQNGETFNVGKVRGNDGLGLDDIEVDYDGERRISFKMRGAGRETEPRTFVLPISIYRGVWQQDQTYEKGDNVTWAGSIWVAQTDTAAKPETNSDWKLAVKRGRDGKDRVAPPTPSAPTRGGRQ
jgi:hypothetical protein